MSYGTVAMEIAISFLAITILGVFGEIYYVPKITDNLASCKDFTNEMINCDELVLGSAKTDEGDDTAKLSGKIKTFEDISTEYDLEIDIWKILELANEYEYMYNTKMNFCDSMQNTDAPWYPIVETLNISGCPVPVSVFEVHGLTVSLDSAKDVLCHEFCGSYMIEISFVHLTDKLSCHVLELSIEECDDEYD